MDDTSLPDEIRRMSVSDRLLLVEGIWDSIVEECQGLPLTSAQQDELDRRLNNSEAEVLEGIPWDEFVRRLRAKT
jgi:putative addiction module component (TIGR02574 family)